MGDITFMCACHAETGKHGNEAIGQKCNYAIILHILAFTGIFVVCVIFGE
jgi:hypothetical protein